MREPPKLSDATLQAVLDTHYGLSNTALTFLPIGNDAASFVYRVVAGGSSYFLKARTCSSFSAPSLLVPRFLYQQGIPHIITPVPTLSQTLWVQVGDFCLSLYPFIEAHTASEAGLSDQQWYALGATLRQIHSSPLPAELHQLTPQESFIPSRREVLSKLEPLITNPNPSDPAQRDLSLFWRAREQEIQALIHRTDTLGNQLRQAGLPQVLCHADLHTWNVLLDAGQQMWIVDWDETILAPKERDLMFVIGGIAQGLVTPHQTTCFLQGYGHAAIDQRALAYYRYAWAVQDMAAYAEEVFSPERSEPARRDGVDSFIGLFAPGNIVAIAYRSDTRGYSLGP